MPVRLDPMMLFLRAIFPLGTGGYIKAHLNDAIVWVERDPRDTPGLPNPIRMINAVKDWLK